MEHTRRDLDPGDHHTRVDERGGVDRRPEGIGGAAPAVDHQRLEQHGGEQRYHQGSGDHQQCRVDGGPEDRSPHNAPHRSLVESGGGERAQVDRMDVVEYGPAFLATGEMLVHGSSRLPVEGLVDVALQQTLDLVVVHWKFS